MYRRWGQAAPDAQPYSSYTEEEFHRAFARWQKQRRGKPQAPEIFVFFKHIDSASLADAGPQLQKVLDFRKSLEESRQVLSHGFANEAEFQAEVDRHLRAFAKGELPKADSRREMVDHNYGIRNPTAISDPCSYYFRQKSDSRVPPPKSCLQPV